MTKSKCQADNAATAIEIEELADSAHRSVAIVRHGLHPEDRPHGWMVQKYSEDVGLDLSGGDIGEIHARIRLSIEMADKWGVENLLSSAWDQAFYKSRGRLPRSIAPKEPGGEGSKDGAAKTIRSKGLKENAPSGAASDSVVAEDVNAESGGLLHLFDLMLEVGRRMRTGRL